VNALSNLRIKEEKKPRNFLTSRTTKLLEKNYGLRDEGTNINLLKTKRNYLYIRNQSVQRCKHFPQRL